MTTIITANQKSPTISPTGRTIKVLTIRQPWAWLIVHGYKRVENRTWNSHHRGELGIHAGSFRNLKQIEAIYKEYNLREMCPDIPEPRDLPFGMILGTVNQTDAVKLPAPGSADTRDLASDRFAIGPWCHLYESPQLLDEPIPATGKLSYWQHTL